MNTLIKSLALVLLLTLLPVSAHAQDTRPPEVLKAEQYLQSMKTVKAHFVQTMPDGRQSSGTFYLSRPGKLRFEYDAPVKDFVVADGIFIYFYDGQLGQQSNAPIGTTLADFLLRKKLHLSGDITVTNIVHDHGLLRLTLAQTADPSAGTITLEFIEEPMQLKKWRVVDAMGAITEVELTDLQAGLDLPNSLFVYKDPSRNNAAHYND